MNADVAPMNADIRRSRLDRISYTIIGAAQTVSTTLGFGFVEKVYENSLLLELAEAGLQIQQQKGIHVQYKGRVVGDFVPDLLVEGAVVVELKATPSLEPNHRQQRLNYLRATGMSVCLLLNFGRAKLEVKRIVWNY
jgi:GxxExxY protein